MADPTVSAGLARGLATVADKRGADEAVLLRRAGIDPAVLTDPDNRVPFAAYVTLMREAKAMTGDTALALHYAEELDMGQFSVVGLIADAAETMLHAFAQLNRYGQLVVEVDGLVDGARFTLEPSADGLWLIDNRADPNAFPELTESTFARMTVGSRQFDDEPFIRAVHVTHPAPPHVAEYDRIFRVPVMFDSTRNAALLDHRWLTFKLAPAPRFAFGILTSHADALLRDLEASKSLRARVERLILPILHTGEAGVDRIAGELGLSRQTLFRRLKTEGATFEKILDDLRRRMALDYLGARKVSVNETAYLVGFSDPAAFSRAFKRWTGHSPRTLRAARAAKVS